VFQGSVTSQMAEPVVDLLEIVQIEHDQGKQTPVACSPLDLVFETL
jgi:hypothetical protein